MSGHCHVTPEDGGAVGFGSKPTSAPPFPIGRIESVVGSSLLTRSSNESVQISTGDLVCEGDIVETAPGGKVCIRFNDGTVFDLSDSARMVLKKFSADPIGPAALFDVSKGTFAFIAGEMAKAGRLDIETPFASIRGRARAGGIGTLSLASLFFALMEDADAGPSDTSFLDDGNIRFKDLTGDYGVIELTLRENPPRTIYVDDPGETIVLRRIGTSISESHVTNSIAQMLSYQNDQANALRIFSMGPSGPAGNGSNGSSTPPPELPALVPINFVPPTGQSGPPHFSLGGANGANTALDVFVPPPPPPPPPPPGPAAGATVELPGETGATSTDTAQGTLALSAVAVGAPAFAWSGGNLTTTEQSNLAAASQLTFTGTNANGFSFSIPDKSLDFLAKNETLTVTYNVTVTDGAGHNLPQQVIITLSGSNDLPMIGAKTITGGVVENAQAPTETAAGTIAFGDVDLTDTHVVSAVLKSTDYSSEIGTFTAEKTTDTTGTGTGGLVTWHFTANDSALTPLAAGQTVHEVFTVTIDDQHGGVVQQDVTITLTGTNEDAVIAVGPGNHDTGAVTENNNADESNNLNASGTLSFGDVDLIDTHSVTGVTAPEGTLGTLTASVATDSTGSGTGGVITWHYHVSDNEVAFLAAGETRVETFTISLFDGTSTVTKDVSITITGTDNAPVLSDTTNPAPVAELGNASAQNLAAITGSFPVNDLDVGDTLTPSVVGSPTVELNGSPFTLPAGAAALIAAGAFTLTGATSNGGDTSIGYTYDPAAANLDFLRNGQTLTITYAVKVNDGTTDSGPQNVTFTIIGTNDAPILSDTTNPPPVAELSDASAQNLAAITGTFAVNDLDVGDTLTPSVVGSPTVELNGSPFTLPAGAAALIAAGAFTLTGATSNGGDTSIGYTYDPAAANLDFLREGQTLTITYAVKVNDGTTDSGTHDVTFTITGTNDPPVVTASSANVSEEGLPGGIPDTTGNPDTTNSVTASGTIVATDADSDPLSYSFGNPGTGLTSGGSTVTWQGVGTNTLLGRVGNTDIIKVTIDNSGHYTVTLLGPVDQPNQGEDVKTLAVPVNVSDGHTTTASTLSVNIEDDSPQASLVSTSIIPTNAQTNVMLVLDLSGSMNDPSGLTGLSRLDVEKAAVNELLEQYDNRGDVMVRLVTFSDSANPHGSTWMTADAARAVLEGLTAGGGTNYDAGLLTAMSAFSGSGALSGPGTQNVSYFLSDGVPNGASDWPQIPGNQVANGIQQNEQAVWDQFLANNHIVSFAVGVGSGVTTGALSPIAFDPAPGTQLADNPIVVTDLSQLTSTLVFSVPPISGAFVAGVSGATQGGFGADGGHMQSITVNSVTYTFDPKANTITASDHSTPAYDGSTHTLVVDTNPSAVGSELSVVMTTGAFTFQPTSNFTSASVGYTLVDNDGDTSSNTLTFTEAGVADHAPIVRDDHVITNISGGNAAITIPSTALLYNDTDADGNPITVTATSNASDGSISSSGNPITSLTFTDNGDGDGGSFVYTGTASSLSDTGIVDVDRSQTGSTLTGTDFGEILIGRNNTNNIINANGGNDVLIGGTGNDTLNGGAGADLMTGGGGNDTFVFKAISDSRPGVGNFDTITDFTPGSDHIDLTAIAGANAVQQVFAANTVAVHGISWFVDTPHNQTIVYVNTTGTANHVDMEIHLTGSNINLGGANDILHHA